MKQQYISPEAEVVCFAPIEHLAGVIEFDSLLDLTTGGNKVDTVTPSGGDVPVIVG